jgi:hypothetical protein
MQELDMRSTSRLLTWFRSAREPFLRLASSDSVLWKGCHVMSRANAATGRWYCNRSLDHG